MSLTKVPSIPLPTANNLLAVSQAIKGILDVREGYVGDPMDQNVTYRDLVNSGIAQTTQAAVSGISTLPQIEVPGLVNGYNPATDETVPPQPQHVLVTSGTTLVKVKWDLGQYPNHSYTEVWRGLTNAIGSATLIGKSDTQYYVDDLGHDGLTLYYYWVRFVSMADIFGPYNTTDGIAPTTGLIDHADIAFLDAANITVGHLSADRIATGSIDAKIANLDTAVITSGTFGTARIGDATITTAKIASTLQSTNYSAGAAGWKISKAGDMELNSATFRGTLDVRSGNSGAHMTIANTVIKVFDATNSFPRVQLGDLNA
ncbi:hypothetical protein [Polynucleobacter sp. UK-Kesae-W10]|uniref:phage tail tip fiber protein n=1 Tax=Polynucleobacter sp. UK-Kesae-W10 TaxID=1819738 RepID=UPI001C0B557F|nr:hypothetical protein [Polynucleobacter sp. UK-Kesae-W10]MBU3577596.1 hypothetical protein [Polynucleobacter sp. UK-Kesae-W10]